MATATGSLRFRSWSTSGPLVAFLSFPLLLALGGCVSAFTHPHRHDVGAEQATLVLVLIGLGIFLVRVARSGTLVAKDTGVVYKTPLRTHRWEWPSLVRFEEVVGAIGPSNVPRRYVRAHLGSGRSVNLTSLNVSSRRSPDTINQLVQTLNAMVGTARQ